MKKDDIPLIVADKKVLSVDINWDAKLMQISVDSNHSYFCLGNHSAIGLLYKNKAYSGITVYL